MKFRRLELWNFKSFRGHHAFDIGSFGGLVLVRGENRSAPHLGSNAVGKSSLLEAIHWCLYGSTPRTKATSHVISWGAKAVGVKLECDGAAFTRKAPPVSFDAPVPFPLSNPHVFERIVVVPQFLPSIFDCDSRTRFALLADIVGIDRWDEAREYAKEAAKKAEHELAKIDGEAAALRNELASLAKVLEANEERRRKFVEDRDHRRKHLEAEAGRLQADLDDAEDRLAKIESDMAAVEAKLADTRSRRETLAQDRRKIFETMRGYAFQVEARRRKLEELKEHLERVRNAEEKGRCPHCLSIVSREHVLEVEKDIGLRMEKVDGELRHYEKLVADLERDLASMDEKVGVIDDRIAEYDRELKRLARERYDIGVTVAARRADLEAVVQRLSELDRTDTPFDAVIEDTKARMADIEQKLSKLEGEAAVVERLAKAESFWASEFVRLQYFALSSFLDVFTDYLNASIALLGSDNLRVVMTTTKGEKEHGGVHVIVERNGSRVDLSACSGGEMQRVDLAFCLSLADFYRDVVGFDAGCMFFDEPTRHMSADGIERFLSGLRDRSSDRNVTHFVVDHHSLDSGAFDATVVVEATEEGSRIVV